MKTLMVIARWFTSALLLTQLSACGPDNNPSTSRFTVTASANTGGTISSASQTVDIGETATFTLTADSGFFASVSGCNGRLSYDKNTNTYTYTTGAIEANCEVTAVFAKPSTPALSFAPVKLLRFNWTDAERATHYRLLENPDGISGFKQVGGDIKPKVEMLDHQVPLYARVNAQYILESCVNKDCYPSATVSVSGTLVDSIGYFKASKSGEYDNFGYSLSLNRAGDTLAVSAPSVSSRTLAGTGAVYVFTRNSDDGVWIEQAYIKASNAEVADEFGRSLSLNNRGNILAVGANGEKSAAKGVEGKGINGDPYNNLTDGDQDDNSLDNAGAVYIFTRDGDGVWSQQAYIKASNSGEYDDFGYSLSLSGNGDTLAVGAYGESSNATGIDHSANENDDNLVDQLNDDIFLAGAVYVFTRDGEGVWSQQAYIKASNNDINIDVGDLFGYPVSLDDTGNTLAVGAEGEDSAATGVHSFPFPSPFDAGNDNSIYDAGAVYVFTRNSEGVWSQQAYIKASNTHGREDNFGNSLSLSGTGDTLAVGAYREDSAATDSGAVYVFIRSGDNGLWEEQAHIKASNTDESDKFGSWVSLDSTGDTLAVGAANEESNATGIDGDQLNDDARGSGAVYLFTRSESAWTQQAYIKASNTEAEDFFGESFSLSGSGDTLAVGAYWEDSAATDINGDQDNNDTDGSGAVYLY